MERLTCDYCRLPFRPPRRPEVGTKVFCCSGCALASQLGIDGERLYTRAKELIQQYKVAAQ